MSLRYAIPRPRKKTHLRVGLGLLFLTVPLLQGAIIVPAGVNGWPNQRTSNDPPANAIDGSLATFTWTTESNSTSEASLGLDFGALYTLEYIRLWKTPDGGGGQNVKDLVIEYTASSTGLALSARTWLAVPDLMNGYLGLELMNATAVNSDGTVDRDVHNSGVSGFASLSFLPVNATGVRVRFNNPDFSTFNHYRVAEFEAYGDLASTAVPEPGAFWLTTALIPGVVYLRRRRAARSL